MYIKNEAQLALTVYCNWYERCQISVSDMTPRNGESWSLAGMSVVRTEEATLVCGGKLFHVRVAAAGNV